MPRQLPDHHGLNVLACATSSRQPDLTNADEIALYQLVKLGDTALPAVADAYDVYCTDEFRHSLNALILANTPDESISGALELPLGTIRTYKYLFFDRSVFRHALDMRAYVRNLDIDHELKVLYVEALERGPDSLLNRLRVGTRPKVNPRDVLEELMNDQFDRSKAHRGVPLTEEVAKQAMNWGRAAMSTAHILLVNNPQNAKSALQELQMKLGTKEHTKPLTELNITVADLVH